MFLYFSIVISWVLEGGVDACALLHLTFCVLLGSMKLYDPDPAFYLNPDPDPGSQTNADPDPDPGQTLKSRKVKFLHEKYTLLKVGNRSKPNM